MADGVRERVLTVLRTRATMASRLLCAEWRPNPANPAEHPVWFITQARFPDDQVTAQCILATVQEQIVAGMQRHDSRVRLEDIRWWTEDAYRFPAPGPE